MKICLLAATAGLVICLTWNTFRDLQAARAQAQALKNIDFQAISAAGDLEYEIQESRRRFLYALLTTERQKRFEYADSVRQADSEVSVLDARMEVLDLNPNVKRPLEAFNTRWSELSDSARPKPFSPERGMAQLATRDRADWCLENTI